MSPSACSTDARRPEHHGQSRRRAHAFVVSTIELEKNTAASRVWLTSAAGPAAPVTNGAHDGGPVWSPDGRWLAFTSRRGEKEHETTLHVLPVDGPGEVRTVATLPDGVANVAWSPNGQWLAFTSRTRDPRYEAKDERSHARKIERFFSRLDDEGGSSTAPSTSTSSPPTAPAPSAT